MVPNIGEFVEIILFSGGTENRNDIDKVTHHCWGAATKETHICKKHFSVNLFLIYI